MHWQQLWLCNIFANNYFIHTCRHAQCLLWRCMWQSLQLGLHYTPPPPKKKQKIPLTPLLWSIPVIITGFLQNQEKGLSGVQKSGCDGDLRVWTRIRKTWSQAGNKRMYCKCIRCGRTLFTMPSVWEVTKAWKSMGVCAEQPADERCSVARNTCVTVDEVIHLFWKCVEDCGWAACKSWADLWILHSSPSSPSTLGPYTVILCVC